MSNEKAIFGETRLLIFRMFCKVCVELLQKVGVATLDFAQMTLFVEQRQNANRFLLNQLNDRFRILFIVYKVRTTETKGNRN